MAGGVPLQQAVLGIAAAQPGPPGAAQSPGKKRKVSKSVREEKLGWVAEGCKAGSLAVPQQGTAVSGKNLGSVRAGRGLVLGAC